jgi:hypothetical protein
MIKIFEALFSDWISRHIHDVTMDSYNGEQLILLIPQVCLISKSHCPQEGRYVTRNGTIQLFHASLFHFRRILNWNSRTSRHMSASHTWKHRLRVVKVLKSPGGFVTSGNPIKNSY